MVEAVLEKSPGMVSSKTRYTALDHSGLEVVDDSDAPEVVPSEVNRQSSLLQPEPYHAAPCYAPEKQEYGSQYNSADNAAPEYDPVRSSYISPDAKQAAFAQYEVDGWREERRYCGLRKKIFISLIVAIALVVLVASLLGGVLGSLLSKKHSKPTSSTAPLQAIAKTGLAMALDQDNPNRLLTYYQDSHDRVIENSYNGKEWTLADPSNINSSVVTTAATPASPLAAASYKYKGKTYRQVFYIASTGFIMAANSSTTDPNGMATNWGASHAISLDTVAPNSIGLAVCYSHGDWNGLTVYYPSSSTRAMQEVYWNFDETDGWTNGGEFPGSDPSSGVGCAVKSDHEDQFLNVYMRWKSSGIVKQVYFNFKDSSDGWNFKDGPKTTQNHSIAAGSDIAVCNDEAQTEYIYYQGPSGIVTRGIVDPSSTLYEGFQNMKGATVGGKLAAAFYDGGSMLMFQNRSSESTMWVSDVSRYGDPIFSSSVP